MIIAKNWSRRKLLRVGIRRTFFAISCIPVSPWFLRLSNTSVATQLNPGTVNSFTGSGNRHACKLGTNFTDFAIVIPYRKYFTHIDYRTTNNAVTMQRVSSVSAKRLIRISSWIRICSVDDVPSIENPFCVCIF